MDENLKWFLQRCLYLFLLAQAYWWNSGTFSLILFWTLTAYCLANMVFVVYRMENKNGILEYNYAVNSVLDIIPAMAVIATVGFHSFFLSIVMCMVYGRFFIESCFSLQHKRYYWVRSKDNGK